MQRAGAIARLVVDELEGLGCDVSLGACTESIKMAAKALFAGRSLSDYYTEGTWVTLKSGQLQYVYTNFLT
jgi:hypothetical protein